MAIDLRALNQESRLESSSVDYHWLITIWTPVKLHKRPKMFGQFEFEPFDRALNTSRCLNSLILVRNLDNYSAPLFQTNNRKNLRNVGQIGYSLWVALGSTPHKHCNQIADLNIRFVKVYTNQFEPLV